MTALSDLLAILIEDVREGSKYKGDHSEEK
jgi:hypothetical protein